MLYNCSRNKEQEQKTFRKRKEFNMTKQKDLTEFLEWEEEAYNEWNKEQLKIKEVEKLDYIGDPVGTALDLMCDVDEFGNLVNRNEEF